MSETPERLTPQKLWVAIKKGRAEYSTVYANLSEAEMTRIPGAQDDWSVKDQIAHLIWWENFCIARITLMMAGEPVNIVKDFNAVNAQVYAQAKDLPLKTVLDAFAINLARFEGLLNTITDAQLNTKEGYQANGRSPYDILSGNTFEHYKEHQPDLERYVKSLEE
jgi:hypothetical protein